MVRQYTSLTIFGSLMLMVFGSAVGCGDSSQISMDESKQAQSAAPEHEESPCTSDPGHHECFEIGEDEIVPWQDDHSDPAWRNNSTKDLMPSVDFYARELNTGLIPTESEQGYYSSERHFIQHIERVLGESAESSGVATVVGDWTKLDDDWDSDKGSSGDFVLDALSDEDGNIFIDGEPIETYLESNHGVDTEALGLQGGPPSQTYLGDPGADEFATLKVFTTNLFFYRSIGSKIEDYHLDGETSSREFTCGIWKFLPYCWWRTDAVSAHYMELDNIFANYDSQTDWTTDLYWRDVGEYDTDSISNRMWSFGLSVCTGDCFALAPDAPDLPVNQVCAGGYLAGEYGAYSGTVGTSNGC